MQVLDTDPRLWYNRGIETKHRQESEMEATNNSPMNPDFVLRGTGPGSTGPTYATEKNAHRAVAKAGFDDLDYEVRVTRDGRFYPIFESNEVTMARRVYRTFNTRG